MKRDTEIERLWSLAEVADRLGVSERQARTLIRIGLPVVRLGKLYRVDPRKLEQWLDQGGASLPMRRAT